MAFNIILNAHYYRKGKNIKEKSVIQEVQRNGRDEWAEHMAVSAH